MKKKTKTTSSTLRQVHQSRTKKQTTYKITDWKEYNQALVSRGAITLWLGEDAIATWHTVDKPAIP